MNVAEVANWPRDDEVLWSDELGSIIRDNFSDAEAMRSRLNTDEVDGELQMLSGGWLDELRSFQKRDVSKLLSLKHGANFSVPGAKQDEGDTGIVDEPYGSRLCRQAFSCQPQIGIRGLVRRSERDPGPG
ncbi:hypothetical protein ACOM2C_16920 [Pseudarthrobacter sp. So.54]